MNLRARKNILYICTIDMKIVLSHKKNNCMLKIINIYIYIFHVNISF